MNNVMEKIAFIQGYEMGKAAMLKAAQAEQSRAEKYDSAMRDSSLGAAESMIGGMGGGAGAALAASKAMDAGGYGKALKGEGKGIWEALKALKGVKGNPGGVKAGLKAGLKGVGGALGKAHAIGGTAAGLAGLGLFADGIRRAVRGQNKFKDLIVS